MTQNYRQKFYEAYTKELSNFKEFETERKRILKDFWHENNKLLLGLLGIIIYDVACIVYMAVTGALNKFDAQPFEYILFILLFFSIYPLLFGFIGLGKNYYISKNMYKKYLKGKFLSKLLKVFGDIEWNIGNYSSEINRIINQSGLYMEYQLLYADDVLQGTYKGVKFEIAEWLKEKKHHGIILCFDSNKEFKTKTLIETKKDLSNINYQFIQNIIIGIIVLALVVLSSFIYLSESNYFEFFMSIFYIVVVIAIFAYPIINYKSTQKIKTESSDFEKRFNIYSDDEIEGRYLITPAFIERFQNLETAFGTKNIKCAFVENKIGFVISTKRDLFEIGDLFVRTTNSKYINNFYNEITAILRMIDYFKLNEKIGL
ncbi:DUF3137 domain-containing protein [bacterium]|nr:DUF3137 domain-containing protein [bacterium]